MKLSKLKMLPKLPKLTEVVKTIFRKITSPIYDTSLKKQERLFCLVVIVLLTTTAIAIPIFAVLTFYPPRVFTEIGIWLFFALFIFFSIKFRKIHVAIYITSTFISFFLLPFIFFTAGETIGGGAIWNLFVLACISYMVESRVKYLFVTGNIIVFLGCCAVDYFYPDLTVAPSREQLFLQIFIYVVLISIFLCVIILFQNKIYKEENELALKQKKEIEDLNIAQNRFFSSMSHEIRTPINTIIGLNGIILMEAPSKEVEDNARIIKDAGKMLLTLVNDILDLSKIDAGKMEIVREPYNMGDLLSEIVDMVWFSAKKKGIDFRLNFDGAIPAQLEGDKLRIKQVLVNILNNAIKYTPKGSVTLSIQCEKIDESEGVASMLYSVTDTGIGIKQENIPHLFNVFRRIDQEKTHAIEGTGLGLEIVKQRMELMGGTIEVNSVYTKGSTFILRLPQKINGKEVIDGTSIRTKHGLDIEGARSTDFTAPQARVLIVDDTETNLMVAEKLLRETQVKTDTAPSGSECLKKTLQSRYDVIFMDHLMPEMDGIECLHEIRKQKEGLNADTPVVVLTANIGSENNALYKSVGFDGILSKPITGTQIKEELLMHLPPELVTMASNSETSELYVPTVYSAVHKVPVIIATDCASDLPSELIAENDIAVLSPVLEIDNGKFLDKVEITQENLMRYLSSGGEKMALLAHDQNDFFTFFADCLAKAQRLVYIPVSSTVAKNVEMASETAQSFSSVTVFDSWHLSCGLGLMVLKACEYARQGMDIEQLKKNLTNLRNRICTTFVVNTTKYLYNAGKVSKNVSKICDALMVHPIVSLKKGHMVVASIKIGAENTLWKKYVKWALRNRRSIDKSIAFLAYSGIEEHRLREIESAIKSKVNFERFYIQKASASISVSCGPGTFGIMFMRKGKDKVKKEKNNG